MRPVREARRAVWVGRRRLRQLENALLEARAGQAELQRRVEEFEKIAEAAGAALGDSVPGDGEPDGTASPGSVPPSLLAAAHDPRQQGASVRLNVGGNEVIAVVGGEEGDPIKWWAAIRRLASGAGHDPS